MPRNTVYELALTTRSPLHIATGQQLVENFDFFYDRTKHIAYVIDAEVALLAAEQAYGRRKGHLKQRFKQFSDRPTRQQTQADENKLRAENAQLTTLYKRIWDGMSLDQLVEQRLITQRNLEERLEVDGRPLVHYVLQGHLSSSHNINAHIKDVFGRPYIPGSSLKGAIRTALAWHHFASHAATIALPYPKGPKDRGKDADDCFEDALFVIRPSRIIQPEAAAVRDVMRMLQVRDSDAADVRQIVLAPLRIFGNQQAAEMDVLNVEAVDLSTTFKAGIQIEHYPFVADDAGKRGLDYASKGSVVEHITLACRTHGAALINHEIAYYTELGQATLVQFYRQLAQELSGLDEHSFLLQLGWGTGWQSKTYGQHLQNDEEAFTQMVRNYGLDEPNKRKASQFQVGDRFPWTRKVVLNNGQPWHPLGWVRVDMREVQR